MEKYKFFYLYRFVLKNYYQYYNRIKLSFLGVRLGVKSKIVNSTYWECYNHSVVTIGDGFVCYSGDNFNALCSNRKASFLVMPNARLAIGDNVGMSGPTIWCTESITIGNNVHIGANCLIIDTDVHSIDYKHRNISQKMKTDVKHAPICIGNDVWIGLNCVILKGVSIGERTIIGAGSVVTKDILADCIAAGNPCKILRKIE